MPSFLTDKDVEVLREVVHDYRNRKISEPARKQSRNTYSKSIYLALIPSVGIAPITESVGTSSTDYDEPNFELCDIYKVSSSDTDPNLKPINLQKEVYNVSEQKITAGYQPVFRIQAGYYVALPPVSKLNVADSIAGIQLAEDHPGVGIPFDVYLGTWSTASNAWTYSTFNIVKAIDHRNGAPYPDAGATGLGVLRESDTYTEIYEIIDLDCSSIGTGTGT